IAAKFVEPFGHLGFLFSDEILPHFAVRQLLLGGNWAVGIDAVAAMNEEIGPAPAHGRIAAHAAARLVDAPALARSIARPHEGDRAPIARRRAEMPDLRRAHERRRGMVLERDAVE